MHVSSIKIWTSSVAVLKFKVDKSKSITSLIRTPITYKRDAFERDWIVCSNYENPSRFKIVIRIVGDLPICQFNEDKNLHFDNE